ncbi:MAG: hypothetical protein P5692_26510, partial [Limnospira sp. PMC 1280.21]|nr:hypothetical protein [Limnospira sp. PMC 1280.21]
MKTFLWTFAQGILGVEIDLTVYPSHSEPYMRLSPHTAPNLTGYGRKRSHLPQLQFQTVLA